MLEIFKLGGYEANKSELLAWLAREEEPGFVLCEDVMLASYLNGLIIKNRGPKGDGVPKPDQLLSNNIILKKLKIALNLQAENLLQMLQLNGFTLSKHEL